MISIITGAITISLLHAVIPNHWLPVIAIGRKEEWTIAEITQVTFAAGAAHVLSTIAIGVLLGIISEGLADRISSFTRFIAPSVLILAGLHFLRQHYKHNHFHLQKEQLQKRTKASIVAALVTVMLFSPCLEIEAYFLLAGTQGWHMIILIAAIYSFTTIGGMLIWVRIVYKRVLKFNWHRWDHNAGIITAITLILTGIVSFFIY